jgi:capsule polysaccharide export protein KpsE/RkpR
MKQKSANAELEVVFQPELERNEGGESAIDRFRLLWENRRALLRITAWGLAVATVIAFLIPARYESTTRLMPPDDQSSSPLAMVAALSGRLPGGLGGMAGDLLGAKTSGALFIGILGSRTVQDDLVQKFDLRKVYSVRDWETARKRLASNTGISEDRKSGLITVTVTDHNPQRAAGMAGEYVVELNSVVNRLSTSSARRERIFLEERLQQVKNELETAEKEFGNFASKNTAIDIKEQAKAMVGAAAALQGEIIAAEAQLEGLKQIYNENNVRVRSLKARLAELQAQLNKIGGKDYNQDNDKEDSLYPSIRKLPVLGEAYADLYRRTKVQEAVFEILTQQYEVAKVSEAKEIPSVKVLDAPLAPEHKSFPSRLLIMTMGVFLSFAAGAIWIVGKTAWMEVPEDAPEKQLAQEVFNTVRARARVLGNGPNSGMGQKFWGGARKK